MTNPNGFDVLLNIQTESKLGYTFAIDEMKQIIAEHFTTIIAHTKYRTRIYEINEHDGTYYVSYRILR